MQHRNNIKHLYFKIVVKQVAWDGCSTQPQTYFSRYQQKITPELRISIKKTCCYLVVHSEVRKISQPTRIVLQLSQFSTISISIFYQGIQRKGVHCTELVVQSFQSCTWVTMERIVSMSVFLRVGVYPSKNMPIWVVQQIILFEVCLHLYLFQRATIPIMGSMIFT